VLRIKIIILKQKNLFTIDMIFKNNCISHIHHVYLQKKIMSEITLSNKKRKNIDLSEDTFRALSILASANGKNLKVYIEIILNNEAKMLNEEMIYREFLKNPETKEIVSSDEKATFEAWLGL
jgi:predicted DNA binding CopG/RHH family protein